VTPGIAVNQIIKLLWAQLENDGIICRMSIWAWLARRVYDFLDIGAAPKRADCIFVLAGHQTARRLEYVCA
jgi:hypothetical protein